MRKKATIARNSKRRSATWFPLLCGLMVFVRLIYEPSELSYDYSFYIRFVDKLAYTTLYEFLRNVSENFPYVILTIQESYLKFSLSFEFGFSALCLLMGQLIPTTAVLPLLCACSIYLKMWALRSLGFPVIILTCLFVFFISLLETNALRAGLAQTTVLVGFFLSARSMKFAPTLIASAIAATFHLSSLAVTLALCGSWFYFNLFGLRISTFRMVVGGAGLLGLTFSTPWISGMFDRIEVYSTDVVGNEWALLKILPILSIAVSIAALVCTERLIYTLGRSRYKSSSPRATITTNVAMSAACATVVFVLGTSLYVFNTIPVFSGRIWQLAVPFGFLPGILALQYRILSSRQRAIIWALNIALACAFVYQFMFRYVLTNFFAPVIGYRSLDLGNCASGLCN